MNAVEGRGITYTYPPRSLTSRKRHQALKDVTFTVARGNVAGLVGHNGAGKTTLLLALAGLKQPDSGVVEILGQPAKSRSLIPKVGLLTDRLAFHPEYKVAEVQKIFRQVMDVTVDRADRVWELMALHPHKEKTIKELSNGLRKRVAVAVSVLHEPELILLDEPFAGLDPESVATVSQAIASWKSEGKTVLVSSHDLPELEELVDSLVVLRDSRVLASGSFAGLVGTAGLKPRVYIETVHQKVEASAEEVEEVLARLRREGEEVVRVTTKGTNLADLYAHLHAGTEA